ncbi:MAG: aminoacyl-tRNA hydrolase [Oscillospiraceae bacterium]|nr:aminoacyl-tRNA hydrolase [Oscillospiraceae bacterium]
MLFGRKTAEHTVSWLVVCLGNPGLKYEHTRHNAGFETADELARRKGCSIRKLKFKSLFADLTLGGQRALLLKPQTYMNLSGEAVREAASFYKILPQRILVVADDVSLSAGRLRIRRDGSAGGHNGLKNIIAQLGSQGFPRIKIGVGAPPHPDYDMASWVLSAPSGQERQKMEQAVSRAADAVETILQNGVDAAMNQYNAIQN